MSWQEVIVEYPWVAVALEIFKGVMPTVIALITVFITQWRISVRERKNKKKDKTFEYYENILNWLIKLKKTFMEQTHSLDKVLMMEFSEERIEQYKILKKEYSKMNEDYALWIDTYHEILQAFGNECGFDKFKSVYSSCTKELIKIGEDNLRKINNDKVMKELNGVWLIFRTSIDSVIKALAHEITKIY